MWNTLYMTEESEAEEEEIGQHSLQWHSEGTCILLCR